VLTVVPASERPSTGVPHNYEHILAFALLGVLFALSYPNQLTRVLIGTLVFALLIELSQIPLPTRHARLSDFLYDTAATWGGVAAIYLPPWALKIIKASRVLRD
jgi:VanZ family protein